MKEYHCKICGHNWFPRKPVVPKSCPHCNSPRWNLGRKRPTRAAQLENAAKKRLAQLEKTFKIELPADFRQKTLEKLQLMKPSDASVRLGTTNAGQWLAADVEVPEQNILDMMAFDNKTDEFWKVNENIADGRCLTGDDIWPGDWIHFRLKQQPTNGEIVLALGTDVHGEHFVTAKHYYEVGVDDNGQVLIELRPSNPKCKTLKAFKFNVEIYAVAVNVIRMGLRKRKRGQKW